MSATEVLTTTLYRQLVNLTVIACCLLSLPVYASEKVTMNMRDADIRALIQWVADTTGKNIVVHRAVQGNVTVL